MTKISAADVRRFKAIRAGKAKAVAANDDAPKTKGRLALPNVTAELFFDEVHAANTADGTPFFTFKGCPLTLADGREVTRTVMAFGQAHELIKQAIANRCPVIVEMAHSGPVMKVVAVEVDGGMVTIPQDRVAQAA